MKNTVSNTLRLGAALLAILASSPTMAQQLTAHVHGAARLELIVQGTELSVSLLSPLDNWVGFEHAPRNAAQKAAIEKVKSDIAAKELIAFNPEALCKLKRAEFEPGLPKTQSQKGDEHAESEASWEFHCEQPDLLKVLRLSLFKAYPRFAKIDAAAADADGQSAATLTAKSPTMRLP